MKYFLKTKLKILIKILSFLKYEIILIIYNFFPGISKYQPTFNTINRNIVTRSCNDRWAAIEGVIPEKKGSILDIGSNIGFFTFKFAEKGYLSHGVEADVLNILISNSIKEKYKISNAIFSQDIVDEIFIREMSDYFLINNLSVFHHWVKRFGEEKALNMLKEISEKCEYMFFETGQYNEKEMDWSQLLDFMGNNPKEWVIKKFKSFGFKKVEVIGQFPTGLNNVNRYLYFAKK